MTYFSGGTEVTVIGSNLNSVAEPAITATVVVSRLIDDNLVGTRNITRTAVSFGTDYHHFD